MNKLKLLVDKIRSLAMPEPEEIVDGELQRKIDDLKSELVEYENFLVGYVESLLEKDEIWWDNMVVRDHIQRINQSFGMDVPKSERVLHSWFEKLRSRKEILDEVAQTLIEIKEEQK